VSQDEPAPAADAPAASGGHPVLVYTGLRLLLLVITAGVLYLFGLRNILLLLVFAFLISGVISIFVLNRRREVAAVEVVTAVQKVNQRIDESARAEDAPDDDLDASDAPVAGSSASVTASGDAAADGQAEPGAAPASKPAKREIPADDDLDDLEPTDRP
jgi:hypothetical protein